MWKRPEWEREVVGQEVSAHISVGIAAIVKIANFCSQEIRLDNKLGIMIEASQVRLRTKCRRTLCMGTNGGKRAYVS